MIDNTVLMDVAGKMKSHTFPSLAAIYGLKDECTGEFIGSGTFVAVRGQTYLLTSGHVTFEKDHYTGLVHMRSDTLPPAPITYPFHSDQKYLDISVVQIDSEMLKGTHIIPVDITKLALHSDYLENDVLFAHGCPGAKNKAVKFSETNISDTQPFCSFIGSSVYPWFDTRRHCAIVYPQADQLDEYFSQEASDDPHGLCGSAVWKTNINNSTAHWNPMNAEIVGVIHHWDENTQCLIATRVEIVRKFLLDALRSEFAYYHWLQRGSPLHDDLSDWYSACKEIPHL
jgi:hypothetical protein